MHPTGFFRQKTKSLIGMATAVQERFGGEVPAESRRSRDAARGRPQDRQRPALGRVRTCPACPWTPTSCGCPTRLRLTSETDPVKVEHDLDGIVPAEERGGLSLRLILHGRRVCVARSPHCDDCVLADICPSAGRV